MPTIESHTYHEFVNVAEHMGSTHRAIDVDPRKSPDPSRQMLASFSHFTSASELRLRIVDEKLGDNGQQRGRLPISHIDQAGQDPIQIIGFTLQRCERFRFRHIDDQASHTEQAEWMTTQGTT